MAYEYDINSEDKAKIYAAIAEIRKKQILPICQDSASSLHLQIKAGKIKPLHLSVIIKNLLPLLDRWTLKPHIPSIPADNPKKPFTLGDMDDEKNPEQVETEIDNAIGEDAGPKNAKYRK